MNGVAERLQRRLLHGLAKRRMGVERSGDILERCAHLDGEPERRAEFGDGLPDCLDTQDYMGVGLRDDAHKALLAVERHRTAAGSQRKLPGLDFEAGATRLVR